MHELRVHSKLMHSKLMHSKLMGGGFNIGGRRKRLEIGGDRMEKIFPGRERGHFCDNIES